MKRSLKKAAGLSLTRHKFIQIRIFLTHYPKFIAPSYTDAVDSPI